MKLRQHLAQLNKSIYVGERFEKNLRGQAVFGALGLGIGSIMTLMNILQHKGFITYTTLMFALSGAFIIYCARVLRKREPVIVISTLMSMVFFSYYAISGANEGFAILWTTLMPLVVCYFMSVKYGILLSVYFELLIIVLFYTPLRAHFTGLYTDTFMNRFPVLYLTLLLSTAISMSQYHESVLVEIEYTERLNEEVRRQTHVANERADKLGRLSEQMVQTLARTIDAKDKYTNGHSFRVSEYAVALAERLGWPQERVDELRRQALLHDIGKIGIPDAVLNKPGRLTAEEFEVIKSHTDIGAEILSGLEDMTEVARTARSHHERIDGKGYPEGLAGNSIPENARIVAIADAFDAMHSDRIYRKALPMEKIVAEMEGQRGRQFDPDYLDAFLGLIREGAFGPANG